MMKFWKFSGAFLALSFLVTPSLADNFGSATGGDAATQSGLGGCIYNSSAPTINNGQQVAVQCDANGNQKINIAGGSITPSGTQDTNLKQVNGATVNVGAGASSTGTPRVTTSTDSTIGTVTTVTNPVTVAQPTGTNLHAVLDTTSTTAVTQATAGNLNATVVGTGTFAVQTTAGTSGGASMVAGIVPNNTTSVAIKASAGQVYSISGFNNSATVAYVKLYNIAQGSNTCGANTPVWRGMIPANGGFIISYPNGIAFSTAISYCVTLGITDADTTAPAASTYVVNVGYF